MEKDSMEKDCIEASALEHIKIQTKQVLKELLETAHMKPGQILVVGCSSSEIASFKIGSHSSGDIGRAVFTALHEELAPMGIYLAAQCCEHLNRAVILEAEAAKQYGWEPVNVVPQLKAGGSFGTAAWAALKEPVAVERIRAHAGIDIGDTLIGMHLKEVAVPVRIQTKEIGSAHIVCARTRPKFIGGMRACYDESRM
ncbi:MAG: TIGR01440 family protein [Clostridiaceae bacterium]|nr:MULTISPECIES: TIGR01440 family protein [Clostridium]MCI6139937.1 TIGR01440 family protein [Clostridium sp.]MDU3395563.1 TIGR01440 family protein [Clostridiales bacterium]MDY3231099.1 TIGR01440 family protein [Clostridiaceae bacterium]